MIVDSMLTLFWIVAITNGLNLLDNMDGLCAGITVIAGAFLLTALISEVGVTPTALYIATLLGATTGFSYSIFIPRRSSWATRAVCFSV